MTAEIITHPRFQRDSIKSELLAASALLMYAADNEIKREYLVQSVIEGLADIKQYLENNG